MAAVIGMGRDGQLGQASRLVERAVAAGEVRGAVLYVARGKTVLVRAFGQARDESAVFLLASLTKPMTAVGVMAACQAGQLSLATPVSRHLPELLASARGATDRRWRAQLTIRHLLDHTSGLPDMPPDNLALRQRQAPLDDFFRATLTVPLAFAPGTRVRYQSMGFLLASEIVARVTGMPFRAHLRTVLFDPLGMKATALGLAGRSVADTMPCEVLDDAGGWNSHYWRDLGAPWGGALGTAEDVATLLRWQGGGPAGRASRSPLQPEQLHAMLASVTPAGSERYGLGWRLGPYGRGSSARTFGHSGATGVVGWRDPEADATCVILTTRPAKSSEATVLRPVSDLVAAR